MPRPDSLPWMEGVDAKLARAKKHLAAFYSEADAFLEQARPTFIRKTDVARTTHWLVFYVEDPYPPLELSAIIGDVLFNLRSALDNLVCGLVRKQNPRSSCSSRQFPICDESDKFLQQRDMLKGVPDEAVYVIRELQPYHRPASTRDDDPLLILNRLSNRDKHRQIHFTVCYHRNLEVVIPTRSGRDLKVALPKDFHAGDVDTIRLPGDPSLIDDNVRISVTGRSRINLRLSDSWAQRPADEILTACSRYVEDRVVTRLKPFFL